jgi:coenzyme Q-binding protein COQ10
MPGTSTSILIDAPAKVVYDVISDFESYPEFLPDVKKVEVDKKGKRLTATFEVSVIKKIRYTLEFATVPSKKISWTFVKGDVFKDNRGGWEFEEVKKGQTKATYQIEVDFGLLVPSLITNKLVGHNLPQMMKRFKERAESLSE